MYIYIHCIYAPATKHAIDYIPDILQYIETGSLNHSNLVREESKTRFGEYKLKNLVFQLREIHFAKYPRRTDFSCGHFRYPLHVLSLVTRSWKPVFCPFTSAWTTSLLLLFTKTAHVLRNACVYFRHSKTFIFAHPSFQATLLERLHPGKSGCRGHHLKKAWVLR